MRRRQLIIGALGIGGTIALPSSQAFAATWWSTELQRLFPEKHLYRKIAHQLAQEDSDISAHSSVEALMAQRIFVSREMSENSLLLTIAEASKKDFSAGRTKIIQGWLLSEMEINICRLLTFK